MPEEIPQIVQSNEGNALKDIIGPQLKTIHSSDEETETPCHARFQKLNSSGLDYQGQLSYGYGRYGKALDVSISSDLAALVPFLSAVGVELKLEIKGKGQREAEMMTLLQRWPKRIDKHPPDLGLVRISTKEPQVFESDGDGIEDEEKPSDLGTVYYLDHQTGENSSKGGITREQFETEFKHYQNYIHPFKTFTSWTTARPLSFITLSGKRTLFKGGVSVNAGFKVPFPKFSDALTVDISISLDASAEIGIEIIDLKGLQPSIFSESPESELVGNTSKFQATVDNTLFTIPDNQIKEIEEYIDSIESEDESFLKKWVQKFKDWVGTQIKNFRKEEYEIRTHKIDGLRKKIGSKIEALGVDRPSKRGSTLDTLRNYKLHLDKFMSLTQNLEKAKGELPHSEPFHNNILSSFSWFGGVNFHGQAGAKVGVGVNIPVPGKGTSKEVNVQLGAKIQNISEANFKNVSYRFQTCHEEGTGGRLFCTQDIYIAYRSYKVEISAEAVAALQEKEKSKEKTWTPALYNTMTYLSVRNFWIQPEAFTDTTIELERRSGFSYGMSVSVEELARVAKGENDKLKATIAKQLRISEDKIIEVLNGAKIWDYSKEGETLEGKDSDDVLFQSYIPSEIFIESTFTFPRHTKIELKVVNKENESSRFYRPVNSLEANKDIKEQTNIGNYSLQSVRLRARNSDIRQSSKELFKLGLNLKIVNINALLTEDKGSGLEGFFDMYVHWYNLDKYNTEPGKAVEAQEISVPPTVLLHQTNYTPPEEDESK